MINDTEKGLWKQENLNSCFSQSLFAKEAYEAARLFCLCVSVQYPHSYICASFNISSQFSGSFTALLVSFAMV